jgi:hypothetical protein
VIRVLEAKEGKNLGRLLRMVRNSGYGRGSLLEVFRDTRPTLFLEVARMNELHSNFFL